jgi:DNA-binding MarR family transcriptional regulator
MLEVEKPSLGRLLDRMEAKGWVRREEHASDRRAKRVYLTEEVQPAIKAMRVAAADVRREALAGLPPERQDEFVDILLTIKANLAQQVDNGNGGNGSRRRRR